MALTRATKGHAWGLYWGILSLSSTRTIHKAPPLCCLFAYPHSGDLSARTSPEEQASKAAPSPRLCTRGVEERSSFWRTHLRDCSLRTAISSTSRRSPLHSVHLHGIDFDRLHGQAWLAMSGNDAFGSFETSPTSMYFLNFMFMFIVFVTSTLNHALNFIYKNIMIYAFIFRIKMNRNWPLIPTLLQYSAELLMLCPSIHNKIPQVHICSQR